MTSDAQQEEPLQDFEEAIIFVAGLIADGHDKFRITRILREEYKADLDFHVVKILITKAFEHLKKLADKTEKGIELGSMLFRLKTRMRRKYVKDVAYIQYNRILMELLRLTDTGEATDSDELAKKIIEFKHQASQTVADKPETETNDDNVIPQAKPPAVDPLKPTDESTEIIINNERYHYDDDDRLIDEAMKQARIRRSKEKLEHLKQQVDRVNENTANMVDELDDDLEDVEIDIEG